MSAAALKNTYQSSKEEKEAIKKAAQKIQWEDWENFYQNKPLPQCKNKRKSTVKKFDEGKLLHDIKT